MTPKHLATTMAALNVAATPPHLQASQGDALSAGQVPAPAVGAAPQGAEPRAADDADLDWGAIVSELNASIPGATKATTDDGVVQ